MIQPLSAASLRWAKAIVFAFCLSPFAILIYNVVTNSITGDPVETMTEVTGQWALRFLLLTLAVTPFRRLFNFPDLIKLRRMLGLYAFFYAFCHLLVYIVFDQFFDWSEILKDILERKYVLAGMLALVLMIPLAITSTNGWVKRLGGKRWQKLHKIVYLIGIAAVTHFIWLVKADYTEPAIYALILTVLLVYRIIVHRKKKLTKIRLSSKLSSNF